MSTHRIVFFALIIINVILIPQAHCQSDSEAQEWHERQLIKKQAEDAYASAQQFNKLERQRMLAASRLSGIDQKKHDDLHNRIALSYQALATMIEAYCISYIYPCKDYTSILEWKYALAQTKENAGLINAAASCYEECENLIERYPRLSEVMSFSGCRISGRIYFDLKRTHPLPPQDIMGMPQSIYKSFDVGTTIMGVGKGKSADGFKVEHELENSRKSTFSSRVEDKTTISTPPDGDLVDNNILTDTNNKITFDTDWKARHPEENKGGVP